MNGGSCAGIGGFAVNVSYPKCRGGHGEASGTPFGCTRRPQLVDGGCDRMHVVGDIEALV